MHEWITDNEQTPHIVVDATVSGVAVPDAYVRDGKIILNVSQAATSNLHLGNDTVQFGARFGGVTRDVIVPVAAVLGVYARETGQGMIFAENDPAPEPPTTEGPGPARESPKRPRLKVVK